MKQTELKNKNSKEAGYAVEANSIQYYPILKAKRGELKALNMLAAETKHLTSPIIELVPSCENLVKKYLKEDWNFTDNEIFIDPFISLDKGVDFEVFEDIYTDLTANGVNVIPVIRINDSDEVLGKHKALLEETTEIAVRVTGRYFSPKNFDTEIKRIQTVFEIDESNIRLILDHSYVDGDTVDMSALLATNLLNHIASDDYRSITIAAGSFVKDLSAIPADTVATLKRYEWQLWNELIDNEDFSDLLSYSDYATRFPIYDDAGQSFPGSSSIRYTGDDNYIIFRGQMPGNHPDGMGQYHEKCGLIITNPNYDGASFSLADQQINECAGRLTTSGNPETWVKISTARHIEKLVSLLN